MISPIRTALLRRASPLASIPSSSSLINRQLALRQYSSQPAKKSQTGEFYKSWTRPVLKTATLAIFTYQLVYWAWCKMEVDEIKSDRNREITKLEAQVKLLERQRSNEKK
ncbi:hypothetical protein QBC35DRAFT_482264 [Podospora australis]|uniref:Uncharacterized protein n=1 Tax=Podospora australis TaxID=1536484 RepID=A0AAN6X340_9PEZI|nr:hypothetical protein QBC35DRAFT_482264 [Podospora australis]